MKLFSIYQLGGDSDAREFFHVALAGAVAVVGDVDDLLAEVLELGQHVGGAGEGLAAAVDDAVAVAEDGVERGQEGLELGRGRVREVVAGL